MKRYYLSPIVITEDEDGNTLVKVKVADYPKTGYIAEIPTDPTTGLPLNNWALVCVTGTEANHGEILKDKDIDPVVPHNVNIDQEIVLDAALRAKYSDKGITLKDKETVRSIVDKTGKKLNANFDFERFFISE